MNNVNQTNLDTTTNASVIDGAIEYLKRQARINHPDGKADSAGRFYPSDVERCDCCDRIRKPSRSWPHSLRTHCRTAVHVANKYNVDVKEMRKMSRFIKKKDIDINLEDVTRLVVAEKIDTSSLDKSKRTRRKPLI